MSDSISVIRFIIGAIILLIAAYQDYKSRLVSSILWVLMAIAGISILSYQLIFVFDNSFALYFIPVILLLFFEWYVELSKNVRILINGIGFVLSIMLLSLSFNLSTFSVFLIILIILVAKLFYIKKILKGKADAKALMSIAILVPYYPALFTIYSLPSINRNIAQVTFPFAIEVLMNAAVTAVLYVLYLFFFNVSKRDIGFPEMFLGYKLKIGDFKKKHVWLLERIDDGGTHYLSLTPDESAENSELEKFRVRNIEKVWVQPQIPFVVFMLIGFILAFLFDDLYLFIH
ncbi:MAG: A24 family peptidase C-terminal domain-containing protein [Thermoplasmata archaeon]